MLIGSLILAHMLQGKVTAGVRCAGRAGETSTRSRRLARPGETYLARPVHQLLRILVNLPIILSESARASGIVHRTSKSIADFTYGVAI